MDYIYEGIQEAFHLLISFDKEIYDIISLSILISITATSISSVIALPFGLFLALKKFRFKKLITRILYTCMSLPPVVVGLVTAIIFSRKGPLGYLELLYTPTVMIIAQTILVTPIMAGIILNSVKEQGNEITNICKTLGGNRWNSFILLLTEMRIHILIAVVTGFGRAVSEVGAVMLVGGNIRGYTRVMTTFIAMNNSMGNYSKSIAMGIVLLLISFIINSILYHFVAED